MNKICKSLFIIADTEEIMEQVMNKIHEALKNIDGFEYGEDDDQPIN